MSNVKERVKEFVAYNNLTIKAFEQSIGAGNGYVNSIVNTIGAKYLPKILEVYPSLSREWLLFGEGEMLKGDDSNVAFVGTAQKAIRENATPVRFFEVKPTATFQEFCADGAQSPTLIDVLPQEHETLDESYCVFQVHGESMAPQIQDHARVLCQEVLNTKWHTLHDTVVVIAYADKFVIKRIVRNHLQTDNYLILASDNPDYPRRETVQLSDIRCIFQARRIISQRIQ